MNVVWDPSIGRYRNTTNGQLATAAQMQAAGVAPRGSSGGGGSSWFTSFAKNSAQAMTPLTGALHRVFDLMVKAGGFLAKSFLSLAKLVAGTVIAAITAFAAALTVSVRATMELARSLALIRANSGRSFTQGYGITNQLGAFGVSSGDIASGTKSNPMMARMVAGAFGFSSIDDPNYAMNTASRYQQMSGRGMFGRQMANSALDAQYGGSAPDSVRLMANLPLSKIQNQLGYNQKIQSSFGINPEVLRSFAEDLPLLINRFGMLKDAVITKFSVMAMPMLTRGLNYLSDLIAKNFDNIADGMKRGLTWLLADFPPMALRFTANALRSFSWLLQGFSTFTAMLARNIQPILSTFDMLLDGLRSMGRVLAGIVGGIIQMTGNLAPVVGPALNLAAKNPGTTAAVVGGGVLAGAAVSGAIRTAQIRMAVSAALRGAGVAAAPAAGAGGFGLPVLIGLLTGGLGAEGIRRFQKSRGSTDAPDSFGEMVGNSLGRLGAFFTTGRSSNYDNAVRKNMARAAFQQQQSASKLANNPLSGMQYVKGRSWSQAYADSQASYDNLLGTAPSNLAGNPALVNMLKSLASSASGQAGGAASLLNGLASAADSKADQWAKEIPNLLSELNGKTDKTNALLSESNKYGAMTAEGILDFGGRVGANLVQDQALDQTRVTGGG